MKRCRRIYLDNNATTPLCPESVKAMRCVDSKFGNASSHHCYGFEAHDLIAKARDKMVRLLGCSPHELIFTSCATESNNLAIQGWCRKVKGQLSLLYTPIEHPSVFNPIRAMVRLEPKRITRHHIRVLPTGRVDLCQLRFLLSHSRGKKLVCVILANHELGTLQDIRDIAQLVHKHKGWLHSDCTQAVGKLTINLHELGVDSASFSAHKFNGPKGIGGLFVRHNLQKKLDQLMFGGNQEWLLRPGTEGVSAIVGMAKALEVCVRRKFDWAHSHQLRQQLLAGLYAHQCDIPNFRVNGGMQSLPGTVSLSFEHVDANKLVMYLNEHGICISRGSACKAASKTGSNVLDAIDLPEAYRKGTIRVGIGRYNTPAHIRRILALLVGYLKKQPKKRRQRRK